MSNASSLRERGQPRTPAGGTPAGPPVLLKWQKGEGSGSPRAGPGGSPLAQR
jgi:hypothetical protein